MPPGRNALPSRRLMLVAAAAVPLAACAAAPEAAPVAPPSTGVAVVGRILLTENGRPLAFGGSFGPAPRASFLDLESGRDLAVPLAGDGDFSVHLPPGLYLVSAVARDLDPRAVFRVPGDAEAADLGVLEIAVRARLLPFARSYRLVAARAAAAPLTGARRQALLPNFRGRIVESPMLQDDALPTSGEARRALSEPTSARELRVAVARRLDEAGRPR